MWMLPPEIMCGQHRSGEHGEIHKFEPDFLRKKNMAGRLEKKQIFPQLMKARHDELAKYLNHNSPYEQPDISHLPNAGIVELTDEIIEYNMKDLADRCPKCREKIIKVLGENDAFKKSNLHFTYSN
jgi:hypothetical protein